MRRLLRPALLLCCTKAWAQFDSLDVTLISEAREYCHVLRFPQGWSFPGVDQRTHQRLFFGTEYSDYEFRVEGVLSTTFLVAGFTEFVGNNNYTLNRYKVDLAAPPVPVLEASRKAWDDAAVVPFTRKSAFPPTGGVPNDKLLQFHGFQFNRTGAVWGQPSNYATRLSPDQAWLVLQSRAINSERGPTQLFFDFFNADTGQKLFTLQGSYSSLNNNDPDGVLAKTGWVTERFFIIPLGKKRDRCLVCDFGKRAAEKGAK
jgi:hypothetical protein